LIESGIHNIQGQSQGMTNDGLRSTSDVSITQHWNLLNQPLRLEYPQGNAFSFSMHDYWTSFSDGETVFFFLFCTCHTANKTPTDNHMMSRDGW